MRNYVRWTCFSSALLLTGCFSPDDGGLDTDTDAAGSSSSTSVGSGTTPGTTSTDGTTTDTIDSTGADESTTTGAAPGGRVRIVHAAISAGDVDVYVTGEDTPAFAGVSYTDATDWANLAAGTYSFDIRPAGAAADSDPLYTTGDVMVEEGSRITAVAAGDAQSEDEADTFRVVPVVEDWGAGLAGRARARIVHAGVGVPAISFDGLEVGESLEPFASTDAEGFGIDTEGGDRLLVFPDGVTDNPLTSFTAPALNEGDEILLVAAGRAGTLARQPEGLAVIAVGNEGSLGVIRQDPELFIVHGSNDAGALEACIDDVEIAANVDYEGIQSTRVSPGNYTVGIFNYPSGCSGEALNTNSTGELEAGERYLFLLTGEVVTEDKTEAGLQLATFVDDFTVDEEPDARVKFVHGASFTQIFAGSVIGNEIPESNVYTDAISWTDESDEVELMPQQYVFGIADAGGSPTPPYAPLATVVYGADPGTRQWIIVAGDPAPDSTDDGPLQALAVLATPGAWTVSAVPFTPAI